jgi:hypothetical protein
VCSHSFNIIAHYSHINNLPRALRDGLLPQCTRTVLSPFFWPNLIILIKSFFLVPRRFRFLICDLSDLGRKQGNRDGDPFRAS